jgi:type VI secretion system protein ImpK
MGSKDDLFGSGSRTVLRRRPSDGHLPQRQGDPRIGTGKSREPQEETVFDPRGGPPSGWSTGTIVDTTGAVALVADPRTASEVPDDALISAFAGLSCTSSNPLLAAGAPLLMLLGDLQLIAAERKGDTLSRHIAGILREFDRKIADAGITDDDARIAKYVLCETADDVVGSLPGIDRKAWLADGMLARFFSTTAAGSGFFEALNKAVVSPESHYDLLELMHACLALGFEGQYRNRPDSRQGLERVRRDVYETLRFFQDRAADEISPSWQGLSATMAPRRRRLPVWAVVAVMPALVAAAFFALRILATDKADAVAEELLALDPPQPVTIRHAEFAPVIEEAPPTEPPPPIEAPRVAQIDRIRQALAGDITGGNLEIAPRGDFIVIQVNNLVLFDSGKTDLKPAFAPVAERIIATLELEPGPIRIVGHTDSVRPSRSSVFKSNHDLSVARAEAVERVLSPKLGDPSRIEVAGKGDEEPIADNATAEGRARNRRVEVMIRKEETL